MATTYTALRRYEQNGKQVIDRRRFNGKNNGKRKITEAVSSYLLNRHFLQLYSGYCLQQRCLQLEIDMDVKITPSTLRTFYLQHDIKMRSVSFTYQQALRKSRSPILHFSLSLARMILDDKTIVYFDESSFNMWMRGNRTWTPADFPIRWSLN